jgi:hypothetical protein
LAGFVGRALGKLRWAGEALAEGRLTTDAPESELVADARRWGIDPALLQDEDEEAGLWEVNLPALEAFSVIGTQWRVLSLGEGRLLYLGLDYAAAAAGLALAGLTLPPDLWSDVQVIEAGALGALNRNRMS